MIWRFTFIDSTATETEVDEPIGWDGVSFTFNRTMPHHGIFNTIDTNGWEWIKDAYDLLNAEYLLNGANGQMEVKIEYQCEPTDDFTTYFIGKFDFLTFKRQCGDYCFITCDVTSSTCVDIFLSRMGQDVDITATTNFDGEAITPPVPNDLVLTGQEIFLQNKAFNLGTNSGNGQIFPSGASAFYFFSFCPVLPANNLQEIGEFNLNGTSLALTTSGNVSVDSAFATDPDGSFESFGQFLTIWERTTDPLNCIDNDATFDIITKGTFNVTFTNFGGEITPILKLFKYNSVDGTLTLIDTNSIGTISCASGVPESLAFNKAYAGAPAYAEADYLLYFFECFVERLAWDGFSTREINFNIDFDNTSKIVMSLDSTCTPSVCTSVYLPELLEFLPTAYLPDGCPLLEIEDGLKTCLYDYSITKGSFIRNVIEPSVPKLFVSFEYLFANINKIFNIGWGFDQNDTVIKIANVEDFYKTNQVASIGIVEKATFTTASDLIYGSVAIGYNKWEAEEYNGLDEMNTQRYYRRNVNSNDAEKDLLSDIIAAGYTIEITRRKNQARTGTSDWRYDDDLFIINTFLEDDVLYNYRGVDLSPANIYSPSTRMNYALTPARNMLRWLRSISAANPTIANDELIFTKGTGNYIAEGGMTSNCEVTNVVITERETLTVADIDKTAYQNPIWQPIYAIFNAPLSMDKFESIKADPYGAIRFQCGNELYNGNIVTLSHDPNAGMGDFKLILLPE